MPSLCFRSLIQAQETSTLSVERNKKRTKIWTGRKRQSLKGLIKDEHVKRQIESFAVKTFLPTMNRLNGSQQKMKTPTTASIILIICKL